MREGGGGAASTGRCKGGPAVRPGSSRQRVVMMLWNLECPVGLSQKRICAHFESGKEGRKCFI